MNNNPLVSIVIPVYNGANYLKKAIDSALAQTYSNFEVIVVNDGSSDNGKTEEIALSYGAKIRYLKKENGGVATALNFAIQQMKGEYFSWLSHDDLYYPNKLDVQIDALKSCGDMQRIVYSAYDVLRMSDKSIVQVNALENYSINKLENSVFPVLQLLIHCCSMLIHRSHFERVGLFDEKLMATQDYELLFRMCRGQKLLYLPTSLVRIRMHQEQGTNTLRCVSKEREDLHFGFVEKLTIEEMNLMYGGPRNFYEKMMNFFKANHMKFAFDETKKRFQKAPILFNTSEKIKTLEDYLTNREGAPKKVCIFGAGNYGKQLYTELHNRGISVDCFCDNDVRKHGQIINGVKCISFESLKNKRKDMMTIVAMSGIYELIKKQLIENDFECFTTKQEINKKFFDVPPMMAEMKWEE